MLLRTLARHKFYFWRGYHWLTFLNTPILIYLVLKERINTQDFPKGAILLMFFGLLVTIYLMGRFDVDSGFWGEEKKITYISKGQEP